MYTCMCIYIIYTLKIYTVHMYARVCVCVCVYIYIVNKLILDAINRLTAQL